MPVVHVRLLHKVSIYGLVIRAAQADAETVSLAFDGADTHHRTHRGIVLRTGIQHQLHTLDIFGRELVQLCFVAHLPAIDIDKRCAFAEHFETVFFLLDAGNAGKHIFSRTCLAKDGALYIRR